MSKKLNLVELRDVLTRNFAQRAIDYEDTAAMAYISTMVEEIVRKGEDPTHYELAFIESEYPEYIEEDDSAKMVVRKRLQLRKIA